MISNMIFGQKRRWRCLPCWIPKKQCYFRTVGKISTKFHTKASPLIRTISWRWQIWRSDKNQVRAATVLISIRYCNFRTIRAFSRQVDPVKRFIRQFCRICRCAKIQDGGNRRCQLEQNRNRVVIVLPLEHSLPNSTAKTSRPCYVLSDSNVKYNRLIYLAVMYRLNRNVKDFKK